MSEREIEIKSQDQLSCSVKAVRPVWVPDETEDSCYSCKNAFSLFTRRVNNKKKITNPILSSMF